MSESQAANDYSVGDWVLLPHDRDGFIRYIGEVKDKPGTWYGIELINGDGKHDGTYEGTYYFNCRPSKGVFATKNQILFKLEGSDADFITPKPSNPTENQNREKKTKGIDDLGSNFVIKRKPGPREIGQHPSGWVPPSWMKNDADNSLLKDRSNSSGKKSYQQSKKESGNGLIIGARRNTNIFKEKPMCNKPTTDRLTQGKKEFRRTYNLPTQNSTKKSKNGNMFPKTDSRSLDTSDDVGSANCMKSPKNEDESPEKLISNMSIQTDQSQNISQNQLNGGLSSKGAATSKKFSSPIEHLSPSKSKKLPRNGSLEEPKEVPERDYNIFFNLNIETTNRDLDVLPKRDCVEGPLAELFGVRRDQVIEVNSQKNPDGFRLQFAIGIKTKLHPSDFIGVLDKAIHEDKITPLIAELYNIDDVRIQMWDAKYERLEISEEF